MATKIPKNGGYEKIPRLPVEIRLHTQGPDGMDDVYKTP